MAVQFVGAGSLAEGTTSLSVPYPSGLANGDLALVFVVNKYPAAAPNSPSGWNTDPKASGGAGSSGADTGDVQVSMYSRQLNGGESGTVDFTISGGNSAVGVMLNFRRYQGSGSWDVSLNHAADSSAGSAYSVTQGYSLGVMDNDLYIVVTGLNGNVQRSSAPAFTQGGVFTTRPLVWVNGGTNLGDDVSLIAVGWIASGGDSGEGTYTDTITGDAASTAAGVSFFLRFRQSGGTPSLPVLHGEAALAGHAASVSVGSGSSPQTITCTAATLSSAGQRATIQAGAVTVQAGVGQIAGAGHAGSVVPGGVVASISAAQITSLGRLASVQASASVAVAAGELASAGHKANVGGEITINAQAAALSSAGRNASVVPGAAAVQTNAGVLASAGRAASIDVGAGSQTITCVVGVLGSAGLTATVQHGAVSVQAGAGALAAAGAPAIVSSGETIIDAGIGVLSGAGHPTSVAHGPIVVTTSHAAATAFTHAAEVQPGPVVIQAQAASLGTAVAPVTLPQRVVCGIGALSADAVPPAVNAVVAIQARAASLSSAGVPAMALAPHAIIRLALINLAAQARPVNVFSHVAETPARQIARALAAPRTSRVRAGDRTGDV